MKTYKWSLRKGGRKMRCPNCGQMRFVPFVLTADNRTMAGSEFGRCDREQSCGYFRYPDNEAKTTVKIEPRPELPAALFPFTASDTLNYDGNTLFDAYKDILGREGLTKAFREYHIGTGFNGACIFPQYDGTFMRTAKAILYGKDGHRLKDMYGDSLPVMWYHKQKDVDEYMQTHQLRQCFFGQHLLQKHPDKEVWIVEAEKTAVLMAATDDSGTRVWLACGGSQMLKGSVGLSCIEGRDVVLVPDDGQYWNWMRTAQAFGWVCFDVSPWAYGMEDGYDIWDIKEQQLKKHKNQ